MQNKETKYTCFIRPGDKPAIWLNEKTMAQYRDQMKQFYYDPSKYDTYLEQFGIKYPTVKQALGGREEVAPRQSELRSIRPAASNAAEKSRDRNCRPRRSRAQRPGYASGRIFREHHRADRDSRYTHRTHQNPLMPNHSSLMGQYRPKLQGGEVLRSIRR